eukprot:CAMPEP_0184667416 /NCGR_PEP_ID=MMETSP0308-20130426/67128_1 /TAXON_ID=38269 /ORGANISM="Gloeochaete witrockiana, Strain SAG 46.84" /LENGTH=50 /DNA_ID=CAMNT_0027112595 /DNA_START=50 /DNA_END=198 /DNA_ORIENTATION=+
MAATPLGRKLAAASAVGSQQQEQHLMTMTTTTPLGSKPSAASCGYGSGSS